MNIYIHIPFCRSRCAYCDFYSTTDTRRQRAYVDALKSEIEKNSDSTRAVRALYIGGGTPSSLFSGAVEQIADAVRGAFRAEIEEFTVECNPDSFDEAKARELKSAGVNRVSVGVQSLDDAALKTAGRRHDRAGALRALRTAVNYFPQVSADIILGLPGQPLSDVSDCVAAFSEIGVGHVSAYELSLGEGTPFAALVADGRLDAPDDDRLADFYDFAVKTAEDAGYIRYEVSNFAREGQISKHNYGYWTGAEYAGFGAGASGFVGGVRYENAADLYAYIASDGSPEKKAERQGADGLLYERIILGLRTAKGLDIAQLESEFDLEFGKKYEKTLKKIKEFCAYDGKNLRVLPQYFNVLNQILINF